MKDLDALRAADFDWVRHLDSVWNDYAYDVAGLHQDIRQEFKEKIILYAAEESRLSPLGWVVEGAAGSGKTHLAGVFRKQATDMGANFVLVDLTDVHDFWETVLQGLWSSLQQPFEGGKLQSELVLESLLRTCGVKKSKVRKIADLSPAKREDVTCQVLGQVVKDHPQEGPLHQDAIRALILLNSNDLAQKNVGFCWLQGLAIEDADKTAYKFTKSQAAPRDIVRGLSWVMSLRGLTVLVFDQLDAIVNQHHLMAHGAERDEASEAQRASRAIIDGLAGGLLAVHDLTTKTLAVVSCLQPTWDILRGVMAPVAARYEPPRRLERINDAAVARQLIADRLGPANERVGFKPPYPTYPYTELFFDQAGSLSPRELLMRCNDHRQACLRADKVTEIGRIDLEEPIRAAPESSLDALTADFEKLRAQAIPADLTLEENEDGLLESLLQSACYCLIRENGLPPAVDALLDVDFPGGRVRPLHARIRLVFRSENDREEHCCLRAIERHNAVAFQARLKAAMTGAGIDRSLKFRRLIVVRRAPLPQGTKMGLLVEGFRGAGGLLVRPEEDELRTLWALHELRREQRTELAEWLKIKRPASSLPILGAAAAMFRAAAAGAVSSAGTTGGGDGQHRPEIRIEDLPDVRDPRITPLPAPASAPATAIKTVTESLGEKPRGEDRFLLGYAEPGDGSREAVAISPASLTRHAVILGGSGSGKTVLVKRIIEEAAAAGIPSIVIDCANDLAGLGDKRPLVPVNWTAAEAAQAARYWEKAEVVVWTPGRQAGNPLILDPLPDLGAMADDPEALDRAIEMVCDSLEDILAGGRADTTLQKLGVLTAALRHFAGRGGGGMRDLIALLADLPETAGAGITGAPRLAAAIADGLKARMVIDPLLGREGKRLDPGLLFGLKPVSSRTRISVINLAGLETIAARARFLSQLAMTLFAWIRRNPAGPGKPLTGLFVLDEAKDFVPSVRTTGCSAGLIRLASQARKYGLGLIFASQEPRSIDHRVTTNSATQIFGRFNAPTSIEIARSLLRDKGGEGEDIARLATGRFYAVSPEWAAPRRISVPLCVSDHATLTEAQVLARAAATRR